MAVEKVLKRVLIAGASKTFSLLAASLNSSLQVIDRLVYQNKDPCLLTNDNHTTRGFSKPDQWSKVFDDVVVWMAAPKKRTSRKTKWLRHQRKFIKNREDIETCRVCGSAKLMNHLCGTCFDRVQRETEEVLKDIQSQPSFWRSTIPENLKRFYNR